MFAVTIIHVLFGTVAVLAGAVALATRKGGTRHRQAGKLFFLSMMVMAGAGILLSLPTGQVITMIAGVFTGYLVVTSWDAVQHGDTPSGGGRYIAFMAVAAAIAGVSLYFGLVAMNSEGGRIGGFAAEDYLFFAVLAAWCGALDLSVAVRKALKRKHRIARHLWRMCFAYFIAVGSLFTGPGAGVFPESVRETGLLSVPEPLVLVLMIFWLVRTLMGKRRISRSAQTDDNP